MGIPCAPGPYGLSPFARSIEGWKSNNEGCCRTKLHVKKRVEPVMVHKRLRYPWDRGSVKIESKRGAMQAAEAAMLRVTTLRVGDCQDCDPPSAPNPKFANEGVA
jgi:hypothetical protein